MDRKTLEGKFKLGVPGERMTLGCRYKGAKGKHAHPMATVGQKSTRLINWPLQRNSLAMLVLLLGKGVWDQTGELTRRPGPYVW